MINRIINKISRFFRKGRLCQPKEEFERCVMCGELTFVPVSTPIDFREDYVVGCGQLCNSCRLELRRATENENVLSYDQLVTLIDKCRKE